jgi:ferric-dicitrate binding protein FerR (iron transport regulator)
MNMSPQGLIDRYLDGTASDEEIRQLDDLVRRDDSARQALFLAANMEVHLRRLLTDVDAALPRTVPATNREHSWSWKAVLKYAAVLLLTVGGWGGTVFFASRYFALSAQHPAAPQVASQAHDKPSDPGGQDMQVTPVAADRVIETRGLVLSLPEGKGEALPVSVGGKIPAGRSLWTCPWGGAAMRLADGSSMQLDRSTVVTFSESPGKRRMTIKRGVFFLTRQDALTEAGIEVVTAHASIDVVDAQVAVAVDDHRTLVEVAEGQVQVAPKPDGASVVVPAGHYLIVGPSKKPRVVAGRLAWRLEPMKPNDPQLELPEDTKGTL